MFKLALQLTTKISLCNDRTVQCGGHGAFIYVKASGVQRGRLIDIYLVLLYKSFRKVQGIAAAGCCKWYSS